jgi:hypothetical protein
VIEQNCLGLPRKKNSKPQLSSFRYSLFHLPLHFVEEFSVLFWSTFSSESAADFGVTMIQFSIPGIKIKG